MRSGASSRGIIGLGIAAIIAAGFSGVSSLPTKAAVLPQIRFSTPLVMNPTESVGEPTIVHSPASDNTVYASGPWGTGTQRSLWDASADGGETFRIVNQCAAVPGNVATECPAPTSLQGSPNPPGGGDTDQRLDSSGKDYFNDLWALACLRVAKTTDHGATANQNTYGCNSATTPPCDTSGNCRPDGADRQWLAVFDPKLTGASCTGAPDCATATTTPIIYQEYNNLNTTQSNCSYWVKSIDGLTYSAANGANGNYGCDGYPSVDQVTGDVFEPAGGQLNIGVPVDAAGDLCFLDDAASTQCPLGGNSLGSSLRTYAPSYGDVLFAVSSMDTGRNLHVTYAVSGSVGTSTSTDQVFTTVASPVDHWTHFATPVQVSSCNSASDCSNVAVFPWMISGGPGRSDSVWYGTNSFTDPSNNGGQAWDVFMSQVVWPVDGNGAVTLAAPSSIAQIKVTPHPAHYNSICLLGTGCITAQGDRNLADFFTVTIDHQGGAQVEYDDTSNGLIQNGFTPTAGLADHPGGPVVTIAQQDSGPGLLGTNVTGLANEPTDSSPTITTASGMTDAGGDGLYPVIGGTNVPAMDFVNNAASGGLANKLSMSSDGSTLNVTMNLADLSTAGLQTAFTTVTGSTYLQYVTRWVMCNSARTSCPIYYAMAETQVVAGVATGTFLADVGQVQSIDLCSVSACDPHVETYPDAPSVNGGGTQVAGFSVTPAVNQTAGTITIPVPVTDIGGPTNSSILEEVGSYAFGSAFLQSQITNNQAEAEELPLEVDGVCCFNFQASPGSSTPEVPWTPALLLGGIALVGVGVLRRRRTAAVV